jgi:hypothetical protein
MASRYVFGTALVLLTFLMGERAFASEPDSLKKRLVFLNDRFEKTESRNNTRDWFYTGLEINYVVLNAADLITTFYGIDNGAKEANPVARLVISNRPAAVLFKGAMTAGVLFGMAHVKKQNKTAAYVALGALNVLYGFVVHNNIGVYMNLK